MRYMGSKGRYAKHIVPFLTNGHREGAWYFEPFLGGGNVFSQVPLDKKHGSDTAKYAVKLLEAIAKGWQPPRTISEGYYKKVKENPDNYPDHLVGFVAYCCSYSGKFWGGYARGNDSRNNPRNYCGEQVRNLEKQRKGLVGARFAVCDYRDLFIPYDSTIYCDPPYYNTTKYQSAFNHEYFWEWCEDHAERGCRVFVSEYVAPPHWTCLWEKEVSSSLDKDTGSKKATERLFTLC